MRASVVNKAEDTLTNLRAMPLVFRASIALLVMAGAAGQLTQHRAAGPTSAALLIAATHACPMAVAAASHSGLTVGDTERTVDRALRWMSLDRVAPRSLPRCGGTHRGGNI